MLRATRNAVFLRKTFTLTPPKVDMSFNLHTTAGVSYKGEFQLTYTRHAAPGHFPTAALKSLKIFCHALLRCMKFMKS